ncbi:MAG TPA: family 43 glycosylhydrolase [Phycisphaerae bacterium]|nr:family 43 glycosylhydrolase [Phycisphaerae bacterium]
MLIFRYAAVSALALSAAVAAAQTAPATFPATRAGNPAPKPPFSSPPEVYSGLSGPGKPQVGDGGGGWRSNYQFLGYDGPDPKPGWKPLGQFACKSTAVKEGLIPPIKPIWDLHLRDTIVNPGPDRFFYMTGSSGDNIWDRNDGIELWRSKDLKSWDYLGMVWSFDKDASEWASKWGTPANRPIVRAVWAPEIHYLKSKKNFYICYSLAGGFGTGLLVSTSGKPEGPYVNPLKPDARLGGGIDPTLFEDDDGKVYMTSGRGGYIALMKEDMSGIASQKNVTLDKTGALGADGKALPAEITNRAEVAMEGASLFKRNGKYYLGGAAFWGATTGSRYSSVVSISDNIYGPYKQFHEAVPCGGGGNYFQDKDGVWFCTFFGNDEASPFREKPGLIRIDFAPDGKIFIADDQAPWILQAGANPQWRKATASH